MTKNVLWALAVLSLAGSSGSARLIEFNPFVGYHIGGGVGVRSGDLDFEDANSYGAALDIQTLRGRKIEFLYIQQTADAILTDDAGTEETVFDLAIRYYHVGLMKSFRGRLIRPFGVFTLGMTDLDPKDTTGKSERRFSLGAGAGVQIGFGPSLAVRLQGRLFSTFMRKGSQLWCDRNGDCFETRKGGPVFQGHLSGGLVLML